MGLLSLWLRFAGRCWILCLWGRYNIARSEQSSHTPGGSHQRLKQFQRKDKIVKDFISPNQVNSEKTLMKNVHMCCISVKGNFENLNKVGKMRISTLIFIYTIHFAYLKVYTKFHNPKSSSCWENWQKCPYVLYRSERRKNWKKAKWAFKLASLFSCT